jgi:hypothetical protein
MTANFLWGSVGTVMNLLTTELNSLVNNTLTVYGPEINNVSAGSYQMGMLHVHLASAAFVDPSYMSIYLVPSTDTVGTAYPSFHSSAASNLTNYLAATVYINGATAVQDETFPYITIPLGKFKVLALTGGACPTLAASGNTVDLFPTPTQY